MWFWWGGNVRACISDTGKNACNCLQRNDFHIHKSHFCKSCGTSEYQEQHCTLKHCTHSIMLVTQRLGSSGSTLQQQHLGAHWDFTLIDYFAINSSWLLAGETSWLLLLSCTRFFFFTQIDHKIYTSEPVTVFTLHLLSLETQNKLYKGCKGNLCNNCTHTHTHRPNYKNGFLFKLI